MSLLIFSFPVVLLALWSSLAYLVSVYFPPLREKRIGILIAHPDDEAMFFSPTVISLTNPAMKNHVQILCLCSGGSQVKSISRSFLIVKTDARAGEAENLRETRKKELLKSAAILGLRSTKDVSVIEDARFQDSMTQRWDPKDIADLLSQTFAASATRPTDIDVLITFDSQGISSHANHISLYYGALHWLQQVNPAGAAVALYSLTTTNIVRKYISP